MKNIKQLQLHTFERQLGHSAGAWKQKPQKFANLKKSHFYEGA